MATGGKCLGKTFLNISPNLKVNNIPSLHADTIDSFVNRPMVAEMFNIVGFHIPSKVASKHQNIMKDKLGLDKLGIRNIGHDAKIYTKLKTEEDVNKYNKFKFKPEEFNKEDLSVNILDDISPADARTIIISEDEFSQTNRWTRVFPTPSTYPYLHFLSTPSYSDHLLGVWELRYGTSTEKREEGRKILQTLCEEEIHLRAPKRKYVKARLSYGIFILIILDQICRKGKKKVSKILLMKIARVNQIGWI